MNTETTTTNRKAQRLAIIAPAIFMSETTEPDMRSGIDDLMSQIAKAGSQIVINVIANNRKSTAMIHQSASKYKKISVTTHKPDYKKNDRQTARRRAAGNMIANSDLLLVMEGNTRAISANDNDIMNIARKKQIKITNHKIKITPEQRPVPTPVQDQPKKSRPPLPQSAHRINLNQYTNGKRRWSTLQEPKARYIAAVITKRDKPHDPHLLTRTKRKTRQSKT